MPKSMSAVEVHSRVYPHAVADVPELPETGGHQHMHDDVCGDFEVDYSYKPTPLGVRLRRCGT